MIGKARRLLSRGRERLHKKRDVEIPLKSLNP